MTVNPERINYLSSSELGQSWGDLLIGNTTGNRLNSKVEKLTEHVSQYPSSELGNGDHVLLLFFNLGNKQQQTGTVFNGKWNGSSHREHNTFLTCRTLTLFWAWEGSTCSLFRESNRLVKFLMGTAITLHRENTLPLEHVALYPLLSLGRMTIFLYWCRFWEKRQETGTVFDANWNASSHREHNNLLNM